MVINKKVIRTMLESKSQYLGSMVLIILSCLSFTMFTMLSDNMDRLFRNFSGDYAQEDSDFMTDQPISDFAGVEEEQKLLIEEGKTLDYAMTEQQTLRIFTLNSRVNVPAVINGELPANGELLLDPAYAKANGLRIGDRITIAGKEFRLAGLMSLPNYIYPLKSDSDLMSDPKTFGIAVVREEDFLTIGQGNSFYQIRFTDRTRPIEDQITAFKDYLYGKGINILTWNNTTANPKVTYVTTKMQGINKVSKAMPLAILLLTCILSGIVLFRMVKRESAIIGTLYALGYRKKEIMKHYLRYPFTIAIFGGCIGTLIGSLLLTPMLQFMISYFNMPVDRVDFRFDYLLLSLALPILFLSGAGYLVVNKALRSSPLNLIRGQGEDGKLGLIERHIKLDRFSFPMKFRIREQLGSIARSLFLVLGVILATMLLMMGFASKSSLDNLMKNSFEDAYRYNYSYVFNKMQTEAQAEGEAFSELPFVLSSDKNVNITVYGVSPNSKYVAFQDKAGNRLRSDQVMMTSALADKLGFQEGDVLKLRNQLNSKEYTLRVDRIAASYIGNYIYMPLADLNTLVGYPTESYMGLWSDKKLNIDQNQLLTTVSREDIKNAFSTILAPIQSVIGAAAFFAFLIGLVVIYVVTSLVIEENKENISLLKIIGYRKKEVYKMVLNGSVFAVILGYLLGVPILLISLGALYSSLTQEMSFAMPITIHYYFILIGFVIIYLTYEISKLFSRRKVNRISMNEVLKSRLE